MRAVWHNGIGQGKSKALASALYTLNRLRWLMHSCCDCYWL